MAQPEGVGVSLGIQPSEDQIPVEMAQPQQRRTRLDGTPFPSVDLDRPMLDRVKNALGGAGERVFDIGGALLQTLDTIAGDIDKRLPMGGFIWEDGDILPSFKSPKEFAELDAPKIISRGADILKGVDLGYQEQTNWQRVKEKFSKDGALSGSAYAEVMEYGLEQGVKSIPDMVAAVFALPAYITARSGEIAEQRASHKGKDTVEIEDVLEAAPFAVASALLERVGAKGMTGVAKEQLGKEMLKAGIKETAKRVAVSGGKAMAKEAATEAMQEGMIEYVGERFGTGAKLDFKEALDRAAGAAVAGGVFGGMVGTTTAAGREIEFSPERMIGKEFEKQVKETELPSAEEAARAAMDPERAQLIEKVQKSEAFKTLPAEDQAKVEEVIAEVEAVEPTPEPEPAQAEPITAEAMPEVAPAEEKPVEPITAEKPEISDRRKVARPFILQSDIEAQAESAVMVEAGLPVEHPAHKKLISTRREAERAPDPVTGLIPVKHFQKTMDRAWNDHKDSDRPFSYSEIDLRNLGGMNSKLGTSGADKHLKGISSIIKEEMLNVSPDIQVFRKGGDEFGVVAPDITSEKVDAALAKAQERVTIYAEENKLTDIPHTKEGREGGIGLVFASTDFENYTDPESIRSDVDTQVESKKKEVEDVDQGQIEEVGAVTPGGQAGRVEPGVEEKVAEPRQEPAEGARVEEKEVLKEEPPAKKEPVKVDYGKSAVESYSSFRKSIANQTATAEDIAADAQRLIDNKAEVIYQLDSMSVDELNNLIDNPRKGMEKEDLVSEVYSEMLYSHVMKSGVVTTFSNDPDFESQIIEATKKQTAEDIKKNAEAVVQQAMMDDKGKITYPQPEKDLNTEEYEQFDSKQPSKSKDSNKSFKAPGHNFIGMFKSTGIPARKEFVEIEGRKVHIPAKPQRIEPIMGKMVKIAGRRIYFGKIKGKSLDGFYRPGTGEIRTRKKNDVEVLAHELAHYLDVYSNVKLPNFQKLYKKPEYANEVESLSYTDASQKLQKIEGFAEFVRLWLTNANEAQSRAPKFYDAFNQLLARDRKLLNPMRDMQDLMHKFYFQGPDMLGQALIGKDSSFLQRIDEWKYRRDSRIRQQTIDRFHAARKIEQELTGKIGDVGESAWKQFRLSNGGSEGIADYILNYGTVEFEENGDLKKNGKSLHDVFAPVKSITVKPVHKGSQKIDLLMRYFVGRRALELHRQGRENLIPKQTAMEWARLGKAYPVFGLIHKEYRLFDDRMLDFYVQAGMITPEGRKVMQTMNRDHVPFNRIRDSLTSGKTGGVGFQRLKGGTANLNDILVNIQDGIVSNVNAALKNRAKQRLYQYISGHKDGAIFATRIAPDSRAVQVYAEEMMTKINKILDASGVKVEGALDLTGKELLTFWQHGVKPRVNESGNIVDSVIIDGKPKYYEVQDPLLQDMLLSMNPESYSSFMNVMFGIKNFFTRTITLGVEFTGANLVRDTVGAAFLSKNNFIPFIDSFKGMYSFIAKDEHYQKFLRSGGGFSGRIEGMTREGKARRRVKVDEFGVMSNPEKLLTSIDNIMSAFEYGTRIGEFRIAKKNNKSDMDAGFEAREISTDFAVMGANRFLTGYIRTVPFLNAMIQSQDRVFREALVSKKYDGNPAGMAMKAFLGLTIPTLALYLINKDDEDYQEIPDWERRTNWHFKVGDGQFVKIPRPYDVGFAYATIPELFFKYMEDEKGKEFADGMLWTMTQMYGIDGVPAMMTGWWDIVRNKKWTGAPVVPKSLADVEATQQYSSNTSETFVRLGESLGVSPVKAEHMFKAYTGYLGGYAMWATDHMLWDEKKFGPKPDRKASDNIFLRRFLTTDVRHSTAAMEKFFDLKEKSDKIVATFKTTVDIRRAIKGKKEEMGKIKGDRFFGLSAKEKQVLFALNDSMNELIKVMYGKGGIKTAELKIKYDKNLTGAEKRNQLDQLWKSRNAGFMQYYTQAKKAMLKAKKESEQEK